jgi:phosphoglycerol transferase
MSGSDSGVAGPARRDWRTWLAAGAGAPLVAALVLELWRADFTAPWAYQRDALINLMLVKETLSEGWPLHTTALGAPFGQNLQDFPVVAGDPLHLLLVKFIGLFSSNPALVANVFYLVQFPLIAVSCLWVLRRLGLARWPAVACAIAFAVSPYHLYRGELHLWLAGCWSVPLGAYLVLETVRDRRLPSLRILMPLSIVIGASEVYYAVLTLVLLLPAIALALARPSRSTVVPRAAIAAAVVAATVAVAHLPTIVYHAKHGANSEIAKSRNPGQSETFGLHLARLVLPVQGHRLDPLSDLTERYAQTSVGQLDEEAPQALGTFATIGFAFLLLAVAPTLPDPGTQQ